MPLSRRPQWWIRVWDYPRLQLAFALAAAALAQVILVPDDVADTVLLLCTLVALAGHVIRIFPYTRVHRVQTQPAEDRSDRDDVSLLVANVLQSNHNAGDLLQIVEQADPDIFIAVETDAWWDTQLASLRDRYPHTVQHALENTYGIILFSRLELDQVSVLDRVATDIPSIFAVVRFPSGATFDLYAVHPEPPQPRNDTEERDAELLLIAKEIKRRQRPAVVAGDLNDVAWSHTTRLFQRIGGLLDPRVGRGLFATFHAEHRLVRWPLDHVFHTPDFRLAALRKLPYFGSDHFPIYVALSYEPGASMHQQAPEQPDRADKIEAAEKISEGKTKVAQAESASSSAAP